MKTQHRDTANIPPRAVGDSLCLQQVVLPDFIAFETSDWSVRIWLKFPGFHISIKFILGSAVIYQKCLVSSKDKVAFDFVFEFEFAVKYTANSPVPQTAFKAITIHPSWMYILSQTQTQTEKETQGIFTQKMTTFVPINSSMLIINFNCWIGKSH